jgi:H/ACA ribonucleoprotein complex subunit 3
LTKPVMVRCPACQEYTLAAACPRCGARTTDPRPVKFSPEDAYGEYRRRLKRLTRPPPPAVKGLQDDGGAGNGTR